jgi:hypothetical protein
MAPILRVMYATNLVPSSLIETSTNPNPCFSIQPHEPVGSWG